MSKFFKLLIAATIALFAVDTLSDCSTTEPIDMTTVAAVIDVRTPAETATGYLEGALLFDIQGSEFNDQLETLDKAANYVVYCRSGNRAGAAIEHRHPNQRRCTCRCRSANRPTCSSVIA